MQGLGFAIVGAIRLAACKVGLHDPEPVRASRHAERVLLRCQWCDHEQLLSGMQAVEWIRRHMAP